MNRPRTGPVERPVQYLFWTKEAGSLFAEQLTTPRGWASRAWILRLSAEALEQLWRRDQDCLSQGATWADCPYALACLTASMLNGMALECLAKAIIVHRHTGSASDFLKAIRRRRHRLVPLLKHAGVTLSDEEREMAERLTTLVEWMGRYPAPLKPADMRVGLPARLEDLPLVAAMYSRVAALLPQDVPTTQGDGPHRSS